MDSIMDKFLSEAWQDDDVEEDVVLTELENPEYEDWLEETTTAKQFQKGVKPLDVIEGDAPPKGKKKIKETTTAKQFQKGVKPLDAIGYEDLEPAPKRVSESYMDEMCGAPHTDEKKKTKKKS